MLTDSSVYHFLLRPSVHLLTVWTQECSDSIESTSGRRMNTTPPSCFNTPARRGMVPRVHSQARWPRSQVSHIPQGWPSRRRPNQTTFDQESGARQPCLLVFQVFFRALVKAGTDEPARPHCLDPGPREVLTGSSIMNFRARGSIGPVLRVLGTNTEDLKIAPNRPSRAQAGFLWDVGHSEPSRQGGLAGFLAIDGGSEVPHWHSVRRAFRVRSEGGCCRAAALHHKKCMSVERRPAGGDMISPHPRTGRAALQAGLRQHLGKRRP